MSNQQEPIVQTEEQTQEQLKTQQKGVGKKLNSYTYWVDQKNKSRTLPPEQLPQKIDPPKLVTQKTETGRSDWNTAGTWQHKQISISEVEKQYSQRVNQWVSEHCPDVQVKKVELKGECEVIFTTKKKALTYQINGKVELEKKVEKKEKDQKSKSQNPNVESKSESSSAQEKSVGGSSQDVSPEKENESKSPESKVKSTQIKKSKSKAKPQTMTFEIVQLTDHGDREFKSKADNAEDKKFIAQKSESLLVLLETILKSYR